jgi:hypothetical protein
MASYLLDSFMFLTPRLMAGLNAICSLQNISMGVGRIWTPTNSFNPKNIYALESDVTLKYPNIAMNLALLIALSIAII